MGRMTDAISELSDRFADMDSSAPSVMLANHADGLKFLEEYDALSHGTFIDQSKTEAKVFGVLVQWPAAVQVR